MLVSLLSTKRYVLISIAVFKIFLNWSLHTKWEFEWLIIKYPSSLSSLLTWCSNIVKLPFGLCLRKLPYKLLCHWQVLDNLPLLANLTVLLPNILWNCGYFLCRHALRRPLSPFDHITQISGAQANKLLTHCCNFNRTIAL